MATIMLLTIVLSNSMSNTAIASLMAPIGISIASNLGTSPHMMLMAIAIASSFSYAIPFGSTPNNMVYGLGGYKFAEYSKVKIPLMLINLVVALAILTWEY